MKKSNLQSEHMHRYLTKCIQIFKIRVLEKYCHSDYGKYSPVLRNLPHILIVTYILNKYEA